MMLGTSGALTYRTPLTERMARSRLWLMAVLMVLAAPLAARAQIDNVTPFHVTVEREGATLQCRIGSASYTVKALSAGQVLKVDGQSPSIYRVEYPAGMGAFVKVEEAALEDGGKTAKLTKPSRLMAPNSEGGVSWWYLLDKELETGTKLAVQKTVKGPDGKDSGYLVNAPAGSKGYLRRDFVRQATQPEIDRFLGKTTEEVKPAPPVTPPVTPPTPPKTTPEVVKPADTTPKAAGTTPTPADPLTPPVNPPVTPMTPPVTPPVVDPPKPQDGPKPIETTKTPGKLKASDAETLNKLYADALKTPLDQVELDAVIAEFERTIESLKKEEGSERARTQLANRVRVLKMRADLQATLRQSSTSSDALKQQSDQVKAEVARLESLRQYTIVGRLVASSVYDGRQLPLMYRVLSPEPASTRTLGYVAPEANADLTDKLGKIVGVVGESKFDESLRVNIVTPTRIEALGVVIPYTPGGATPAPGAPAPGTSAPAPAPPAPAPVDQNK